MSRREIVVVCELAAHLAKQETCSCCNVCADIRSTDAVKCAQDAMTLQRIGQRATRAMDRYGASEAGRSPHTYSDREYEEEQERIIEEADTVLEPYGLKAQYRDEPFRPECLYIIGLPSNGDGEGYAI